MPGPLSEAHAEYESECESCHTNFKKEAMTTLCLDCHKDVAKDLLDMTGFHGRSQPSLTNSCDGCHTEHEGRDFDIVGLAADSFNHSDTDFALEGAHQTADCASCHEKEEKFRDASSACFSCHQDKDIHSGALGEQCESCHQPQTWHSVLPFDHDTTDFPLVGRHLDLSCTSCHVNQQYEFSSHTCVDCHKISDVHNGANGRDCGSCHSPQDWRKLDFDHDETDFPLRGKHQDIPCHACHLENQERKDAPQECHGCHANDDVHLGRNGEKCETCHDTSQWQNIAFDHDKDTDFPLTGNHIGLSCTQCHTGKVHDSIARDCAGCHMADDVHNDPSMAVCGTCHNTLGWDEISEFDHDFTALPLIGMHQIVPCENCHIGNQFAGTKGECLACHKKDDVHEGSMGNECNQCHSPNAWNIWQFDHERFSGYALEGKHEDLACESCHLPGSNPGRVSSQCGSCHRGQDIHNGGFGEQCGRCHNTTNFFELSIQ